MSDFFNKYPYTDFHELNLDWIINRIKELTKDWMDTVSEWNSTKEEWTQLYNYVHDYFNNLDVQTEINHKIDSMILDGTFQQIISDQVAYIIGNAKLMFNIRTKVGSNDDYELTVSNDGKGFTPVEDFKNFLADAPAGIGSDWLHYEENGTHVFTITYYGDGIDGYIAITDDFINWRHGTFYVGFREASGYTNPYIWTPQLFKYGDKYYVTATVQESAAASHATFYGDSLERHSSIYATEVTVNFDTAEVTAVGSISQITFPDITDRLGNSYDVNDYMMDAWFISDGDDLYCLVNDRYMLMIHSFKLISGFTPMGTYGLLKSNIFGLRAIEAPTVLQISSNTWKVNACLYGHDIINYDQNITCFTHDFTNFYSFDTMGCTDQQFTGSVYTRMRNPSPFYMTGDQQYNFVKLHEVKTNAVNIPLTAAQINLNTARAKLFNYHDVLILPESVFAVNDNISVGNFSILSYFGNVDMIKLYAKSTERIFTFNSVAYTLSTKAQMYINPADNSVMALSGEQNTIVSGSDAIELKTGFETCTITNTTIRKIGNNVNMILNVTFNVPLTLHSDNIIAQIKTNMYRPFGENVKFIASIGTNTNSLGIAMITIGTSGNIVVTPLEDMTLPASYSIYISTSFTTNKL